MGRRRFNREFKVEAVRLVKDRSVSVAQAARDLDVHENVLRKWVKEFGNDPAHAFPGRGQMKPEQQEIERLRREAEGRAGYPKNPRHMRRVLFLRHLSLVRGRDPRRRIAGSLGGRAQCSRFCRGRAET